MESLRPVLMFGGHRALRVSMLDAQLLDDEFFHLLMAKFSGAFKFFNQGRVDYWKPEMEASLRASLYYLSLNTPGLVLQNLKYTGPEDARGKAVPLSSTTKMLFFALNVGGRWAWARLRVYMTAQGWWSMREEDPRRVFAGWCDRLEATWAVLAVLNFVAFLYNGRYRSLVERALSMRLVLTTDAQRFVSYEFLNRQIMWQSLAEFASFVTPLLLASGTMRRLMQLFPQPASSKQHGTGICPLCERGIVTPYEAQCQHVYCYICIKRATMQNASYECPVCSQAVRAIRRVRSIAP